MENQKYTVAVTNVQLTINALFFVYFFVYAFENSENPIFRGTIVAEGKSHVKRFL